MPEAPRPPADAPRLALGLDYGERRIGVAIGETLLGQARDQLLVHGPLGRRVWVGELRPDQVRLRENASRAGAQAMRQSKTALFLDVRDCCSYN